MASAHAAAVEGLLARALADGRTALTEPEAKAAVARYGVTVPRGEVVRHMDDLGAACARLRPPLALKVISDDLLHKSDAGGVHLGIEGLDGLRLAARSTAALPGRQGWLVEEMAPSGLELVVGGVRHARFGPLVMVGIGGVLVEFLGDVAVAICPLQRHEAGALLDRLRAAPLLDGVRGRPGVDREALVDLLIAVGGEDGLLMRHADAVAELDLNPVIASQDGATAVDARLILSPARGETPRQPVRDLAALLEPRAVAVAGASTGGKAQANQYIRNLRAYGYAGRIYAVHPQAETVDGLPAVPSFGALPEAVDYAYVAVAAERCPALLAAAEGKVRFAQVMSGGFGEGGTDRARETELLAAAAAGGCRVLGPNCMGTHSTRGRLTYMSGVDATPGPVSVVAQSGGLSSDVLRRGAQRGLCFRALVTVGNAADVGPAELAEAFLDDPETGVLGFYLEDPRRGARLFEALRARRGSKPVVALVGGTTAQGERAARSHTGALAGDARAWQALAAQTGLVLTETLDEFLDVALAMQMLRARPGAGRKGAGRRVVLLGNGGGTSVLAADAFARVGLDVSPLDEASQAALEALDLPVGSSVVNPVDVPANVMARENGEVAARIVHGVFEHAAADALVIHMNVPVILGYDHADILGQIMNATLERAAGGPCRCTC